MKNIEKPLDEIILAKKLKKKERTQSSKKPRVSVKCGGWIRSSHSRMKETTVESAATDTGLFFLEMEAGWTGCSAAVNRSCSGPSHAVMDNAPPFLVCDVSSWDHLTVKVKKNLVFPSYIYCFLFKCSLYNNVSAEVGAMWRYIWMSLFCTIFSLVIQANPPNNWCKRRKSVR